MSRSLILHVLNTERSSLARSSAPADRRGANYNSNNRGQGTYPYSPLTQPQFEMKSVSRWHY